MPLQVLTLKLDGITAGDYLTWCRDPDPPALDFALRSVCVDSDPLGDTITALLDWKHRPPAASVAAAAAGLPLCPGIQIERRVRTDALEDDLAWSAAGGASPGAPETIEPFPVPTGTAGVDFERLPAAVAF
jgi:hypothetical protein